MRHLLFAGGIMSASILLAPSLSIVQSETPNETAPLIEGIPQPTIWQNAPASWKVEGGQMLTITAGKQTDWFVSPMGDSHRNNSPRFLFKPAADFLLSAKVNVGFRSQWDAGALVLYESDSLWAKLCFENTIEKRTAIVSVVTRDASDDSSSIEMTGPSVYLKIAKSGPAIFFYASQDGQSWKIIRTFSLGKTHNLLVGFSSQSPVGDGATTVFSDIRYAPRTVNLWLGK
jgi:regulation of enolase protein 1 (concanavalin A-like superfamily)